MITYLAYRVFGRLAEKRHDPSCIWYAVAFGLCADVLLAMVARGLVGYWLGV